MINNRTASEHIKEIESALYEALEALENDDLIRVRQCAGQAQQSTNDAWRARRREHGDVK